MCEGVPDEVGLDPVQAFGMVAVDMGNVGLCTEFKY